jgi:hypothetical protein
MGVDLTVYRSLEALLRSVDRLPTVPRLKAIATLAWWLTWAEALPTG